MAPWTIAQIIDIALVDELFNMKRNMDHQMELHDTLLRVHPKLCAHTPSVQLGKGMLCTALNERVPNVLSWPSWWSSALMWVDDIKWVKMGSIHLFVQPKWCTISFGKNHIWPIPPPFLVPKLPMFNGLHDRFTGLQDF